MQVNATAGLAAGFIVASFFLLWAINSPAFDHAWVIQVPFLFGSLAVPVINLQGWTTAARWAVCLLVTGVVAATIWAFMGSGFDLQFYFVLFSVLPVVLFSTREWPSITVLFLLNLGLYLYCQYVGVPSDPKLTRVAAPWAVGLRLFYVVSAFVSLLLVMGIAEQQASKDEEELELLSGSDVLTGLANRRAFEARLKEAIVASKRTHLGGAVLFLDLDGFKSLNDQHGHAAGDHLLQEVGRRLTASVRQTDLVARFGGDEFVALLGNLGTDTASLEKGALVVAEKVRSAIEKPFPVGHRVLHSCTASVGIAVFSGPGVDAQTLIQNADSALYQSKGAGKNQVSLFGSEGLPQ